MKTLNPSMRGLLSLAGLFAGLFATAGERDTKKYAKAKTTGAYTDRVGMPHGESGDKLRRKAMRGIVGLQRRGPYDGWAMKQNHR